MEFVAYGVAHLVAVFPSLQVYFARVMDRLYSLVFWSSFIGVCTSTTITDIQGPAWQSPFAGQNVTNVTGIVTAKADNGFYIVGDPVTDIRVSNGLFVFSTSAVSRVNVGDLVSLAGRVQEFRSSTAPNDLFTTEIAPTLSTLTVLSSNHTITPIVLGKDRLPPTISYSALDVGPDGVLSSPNNVSRIEVVNATLQPDKYGLDFWESLEGQLVSITNPVVLDFPNRFGEFWVHGDWPVSGKNDRGGLTMTFGLDGVPDLNPEAIIIGDPLDGTDNPLVALGTKVSNIVGVVTFQFGFFYVLPLTAPEVISTNTTSAAKSSITTSTDKCVLTVGDYNVENMAPTSAHVPTVADHIANFLNAPDIVFVQEIQDNSGPTDDGVVLANITLTALTDAIAKAGNVTYDFIEIPPVDGQDGGQPGGNIRTAFLYRPEKLSLVPGSPVGGSLNQVEVVNTDGKTSLNFNPGRIDPTNPAWDATRKPLVAEWQTASGTRLFTVNLHLSSKGGSSSLEGDARPPINLPVDTRTKQVESVSAILANQGFLNTLFEKDTEANVIVAGDFNEFTQARSVLASLASIMSEADELANIPPAERYTYVFDQNTEQLDHIFLSKAIGKREVEVEHVHVNNWSPSLAVRVSDHDPSVARIRVC
ncbi:hypothetical protein V5O48_001899 [Marasmius crinis-equi]|uniref:Endonuclease/exonuclease/phosphatase domain-containing protein n=1 Tax=Marasmius crinis-equi TaxID=585013 RepID=A0ABR3FXQ4_9AGAR